MYKNIKAAVMGSINADMILNMDIVPEVGENVLGTTYGYANGGKGANQAVGLARLGAQVKMIGKVADDSNGHRLIENLIKNNVDPSGVSLSGAQTGLAAIIIDGNGRNRIVVYEGANAEIDPIEAADCIDDSTDLLLVQFETNEDAVVNCVNRAISKKAVTVIDCGPAKNFALEKMQGATIITPNESETKALTGIFPEDESSILEASRILENRSKAKYVVLKLGDRGCSVWDGESLRIMPPYPCKVVDTTAAGDCFTAAMALEYIRTGDIYTACDMGNKAGSIAVSRMGADASMPSADELFSI
ncbi:MAG: ribokinase [Acutalibacteraceae bacterium]|nr:ribokinase [Acutalibacteraceae bacterium]